MFPSHDLIQERTRIAQSVLERNIKDSIALVSEYKHVNTLNQYNDQEPLVSKVRVNSLRSDAEKIIETLKNRVETKSELVSTQTGVLTEGDKQTAENSDNPQTLPNDVLANNENNNTDAIQGIQSDDDQLEKSLNDGLNSVVNTNDEQHSKSKNIQEESMVESMTTNDLSQQNKQSQLEISNNEIIDTDNTNSKTNTYNNEGSSSDQLTNVKSISKAEINETLVKQSEFTSVSNVSNNPDSISFETKTDRAQQNDINSSLGEMTESINPNNTSELITESENQNGSTDRLVNESKKSNVVNDVSVEDKTNLFC